MPTSATNAECDLLERLRREDRLFVLVRQAREAREPELHVQRRLRQEFPAELVRAALALEELRRKAGAKFARAESMWLDRRGLEQATSAAIARHKARRFTQACAITSTPQGSSDSDASSVRVTSSAAAVWDLCCGIGGDTIALADYGDVIAVDCDPAACLRTTWNAEVYGVRDRVRAVCADVQSIPIAGGLVHIDPDRRAGGGPRSIRLEDAEPGLDFLHAVQQTARGGAIKLSPAANFGGKFPDAEIELISLGGECKEATVWFGELGEPAVWRATVLPSGQTLAGDPLESIAEVAGPGRFVYDPDPAVVRAGLVDLLAVQLGLRRLDDAEEYLTSDQPVVSPFVQTFELLAELPNNPRDIRRSVREQGFGQVEIKARHIPIDAPAVRRRLPLDGTSPGVLIFARLAGKARALVCRRLAAAS